MKKVIFLPIIALLIFAVCLYGVFPMFARAKSLKNSLNIQTADLTQKKAYFANLQSLSQEIEKNEALLQTIATALPAEIFVPSLMSFFQTACSENGVILEGFSYEEPTAQQEGGLVKQAFFNLNVKGGLLAFFSFLETLEKSARVLDVGSISFQVGDAALGGAEQSLTFNIRLKTYSY